MVNLFSKRQRKNKEMPETVESFAEENQPPPPMPDAEAKKENATYAKRLLREDRDVSLLEYLRSFSDTRAIQVRVVRKTPKTWNNHTISGNLDTHDEPLSEEDIRDLYGGGKYHLKVMAQNDKGSWVHAGHRTVEISGDPKVAGIVEEKRNDESRVVDQAISAYKDLIQMQRDQKPSDENPALAMVVDGLNKQLHSLQQAMTEKDRQLLEVITKEPGESKTDRILEKMIDGESSRLQALRANHDSELRQLRENNRSEIDRLHTRYEEQARRQDDAQKREVDNLRSSFEIQMESFKVSQQSVVSGYQREIKHLDRELTKTQTELETLRAKKDKNAVDMVTELATVKEALDTFKGAEEEAGGSTWERVVTGIMSSPLAEGISHRIAEGPGGPAPTSATTPAEPPINQPFKTPDGRILVRKSDGTIVEIRQKKTAPRVPGELVLDPSDVSLAVTFMENAITSGTGAKDFAASARNLIPPSILQALASRGVDDFLGEVANLEPSSPLSTQNGRNWVREVGEILLGSN